MDISLKRIVAYIIDILIVTIVATAITNIPYVNPYKDEYNAAYEKYVELTKSENVEKDVIITMNHDLYQYRVYSSAISVCTLLLYFGVLEYVMNGQTIGKKLMKIKVVSIDDKKLNVGNYLLKVIILNNIIFTIIAFASLYLVNENIFYYIIYVISLIESAITMVIILMLILRKDCRSLHDMISHTKVIDLNNTTIEEEVEVISKKETIKEKSQKVEKKRTKKNSK